MSKKYVSIARWGYYDCVKPLSEYEMPVVKAIAILNDTLNSVPEEHKASVVWAIHMPEDGNIEIRMGYYREETPGEAQDREFRLKCKAENIRKEELAQLATLKARYPDHV